ncbi:ARO80-positive transcription regulator of ARO9 ARO10 [Fusarium mundagurra]|uniref:ARO80-positive transcription regulator of ARO9 ARO10 n=1 Tax=Fusarium mundagurra TaxID=1567541 RepID=A0A8H5XVN2_9HYPO|nr:ARO80-positive transcription regulator of ARO9 ARO10 [Fusarium mundagurra]
MKKVRRNFQHNERNISRPNDPQNNPKLSTPTAESDHEGLATSVASSRSMQPPLHRLPDFHLMLPLTTRATDNIDTVVHAPISNDGDTIKLLQQSSKYEDAQDAAQRDGSSALSNPLRHGSWTMNGPFISDLSSPSIEALRLWNSLRFVRMGWLTALEAVSYMDLFFENILPLSPVMDDFYSHHDNHYKLITQEPLLCCTILMISSRFHCLQGTSSWSRSVALHTRLWEHCEHLVNRIIFGQEKKSKAKTRTLGSIQALILMTEWAPRSVYFPPKSDGWDSDLLFQLPDERDQLDGNSADVTQDLQGNWYRDVVAPAKTIDRMSWMLLGCAVTLGHEIGLFTATGMNSTVNDTQHHRINHVWLRKVIFIADEQLSSRNGLTSVIPSSLNSSAFEPWIGSSSAKAEQTRKFVNGQLALAELARSISNTLFSSRNTTQEHIQSYKYVSSIEEYQQKLAAWREVYLDKQVLSWHTYDLLEIEYQYATVFLHSLGMQAVVDRSCRTNPDDPNAANRATGNWILNFATPTDLRFINTVIQGSCELMQSAIHLAERGSLQYCPTRVITRVIGVSVFLLKALGLGVERAVFNKSLDRLEHVVRTIRHSTWDDLDLAKRYADVLHHHIYQLKNGSGTRGSHQESSIVEQRPGDALTERGTSYESSDLFGNIHVSDDWPDSLAFLDASLAPFGIATDESSGLAGLGDSDWSLLWNIPSFYTPLFPP